MTTKPGKAPTKKTASKRPSARMPSAKAGAKKAAGKKKQAPRSGKILAFNLRKYREAAGLTRKELGEMAGLTPNYTARVEKGTENISVFNLEAIAKVLKVEVFQLLIPPAK